MALKAAIFDFGGVLVRTSDWTLRRRWETELGLVPGQSEDIVFGKETAYGCQIGIVSDADHWRWVQQRLCLSEENVVRFRRDFFASDYLDGDLVAYIDRLHARFHVGLLSNASSNAREFFARQYDLLGHFDSVTISAEEGVMKPDARIFQIALGRAGVRADEAVFVDDALANVEAARALGMQAVHFRDPVDARRQLGAITGVA